MSYIMTYCVTITIGIGGLLLAFLVAKKTPRWGILLAITFAIIYVLWHSKACGVLLLTASLEKAEMLDSVLLLVAIGSLIFVWLGLVLFWPDKKYTLGYPVTKNTILQFTAGLIVGCTIATMFVPRFWFSLPQIPWGSILPVVAGSVLPLAIVEESVFRGRLLSLLSEKINNIDFVLLLQAIIFLIIHIPFRVRKAGMIGNPTLAIGEFATVLVIGWLLGWIRYRSKNLWMSTGCHFAYNMLLLSYTYTTGVALH